jgi:hypothetical protein
MDYGRPVSFGLFVNPVALSEHSLAVAKAR